MQTTALSRIRIEYYLFVNRIYKAYKQRHRYKKGGLITKSNVFKTTFGWKNIYVQIRSSVLKNSYCCSFKSAPLEPHRMTRIHASLCRRAWNRNELRTSSAKLSRYTVVQANSAVVFDLRIALLCLVSGRLDFLIEFQFVKVKFKVGLFCWGGYLLVY